MRDIRPATDADHAAITALLMAQFREHAIETGADRVGRVVTGTLGRSRRGRFLVATSEGRVVGLAALSFVWALEHGGKSAWLEELYVEPAERGKGIGTELLRAACRTVAEAGGQAVDLEVDAGHRRAARLYEREGFRPLERARWVLRLDPPAERPAATQDAERTGGCFCGAIRYRLSASPIDVSHCHCNNCRRTTGAPFVTWGTFPAAAFAFTAGTPAELRSTPQARRTFCSTCGTALTFTEDKRPHSVDVTAGSLDRPNALTPDEHIWTSRQLAWVHIDDDLSRHPEENPAEQDYDPSR